MKLKKAHNTYLRMMYASSVSEIPRDSYSFKIKSTSTSHINSQHVLIKNRRPQTLGNVDHQR